MTTETDPRVEIVAKAMGPLYPILIRAILAALDNARPVEPTEAEVAEHLPDVEARQRGENLDGTPRRETRPVEPPPLRSQWHEYTPVKVGSSAPRPVEPQLTPETAPTMADMQRMTDDLLTDPAAMDAYMAANPLPVEPPVDEDVAGIARRLHMLADEGRIDRSIPNLIERQQAEIARAIEKCAVLLDREADKMEREHENSAAVNWMRRLAARTRAIKEDRT